jgi:hypothetical protein
MRERPGNRGSSASLAVMATSVFLVRPRTHSPNPIPIRTISGEKLNYPNRARLFKSDRGNSRSTHRHVGLLRGSPASTPNTSPASHRVAGVGVRRATPPGAA